MQLVLSRRIGKSSSGGGLLQVRILPTEMWREGAPGRTCRDKHLPAAGQAESKTECIRVWTVEATDLREYRV